MLRNRGKKRVDGVQALLVCMLDRRDQLQAPHCKVQGIACRRMMMRTACFALLVLATDSVVLSTRCFFETKAELRPSGASLRLPLAAMRA